MNDRTSALHSTIFNRNPLADIPRDLLVAPSCRRKDLEFIMNNTARRMKES